MNSDLEAVERFLRNAGRLAGRAIRELTQWLDRTFRQPEIIWIDRSYEPFKPHDRVGIADCVTGQTIRESDRVCVCSACDATYLAATWRDLAKTRGNACVQCGGRGTVREV